MLMHSFAHAVKYDIFITENFVKKDKSNGLRATDKRKTKRSLNGSVFSFTSVDSSQCPEANNEEKSKENKKSASDPNRNV